MVFLEMYKREEFGVWIYIKKSWTVDLCVFLVRISYLLSSKKQESFRIHLINKYIFKLTLCCKLDSCSSGSLFVYLWFKKSSTCAVNFAFLFLYKFTFTSQEFIVSRSSARRIHIPNRINKPLKSQVSKTRHLNERSR